MDATRRYFWQQSVRVIVKNGDDVVVNETSTMSLAIAALDELVDMGVDFTEVHVEQVNHHEEG